MTPFKRAWREGWGWEGRSGGWRLAGGSWRLVAGGWWLVGGGSAGGAMDLLREVPRRCRLKRPDRELAVQHSEFVVRRGRRAGVWLITSGEVMVGCRVHEVLNKCESWNAEQGQEYKMPPRPRRGPSPGPCHGYRRPGWQKNIRSQFFLVEKSFFGDLD